MKLGFLLAITVLIIAMAVPVVAVGYLAVREHFGEIPLSRSTAIATSSFLAAGLLAAWLTLAIFGLAVGQSLGNANVGSLIGGVLGLTCWVATTVAYGSRMTRRLAELQVLMRPSSQIRGADRSRARLRVGLAAIFVVVVVFVAGVAFVALSRTNAP